MEKLEKLISYIIKELVDTKEEVRIDFIMKGILGDK